jgi:DNA-binding transcriptional LysR family regulator
MRRAVRRDLDISLLRSFVAIVETGSVTGAARLLNRTQAAVSLQLKRLEDLLGQSLFERVHKRLLLAPAGEQLLGNAKRLIAMNDDVWGQMTTPSFEGEVRLGVPVDLISTYIPQVLRRFSSAWPRVRVCLVCRNSQELIEDLEAGNVDLTLTTDIESKGHCETLRWDKLVWVNAPGGDAHTRVPLPIAIGGKTCRFRPVALQALRDAGRAWQVILQVSNQDAVTATIASGSCVGIMLRECIPDSLDALPDDCGLPELPNFAINLWLPRAGANDMAEELARHIRAEFASRRVQAPDLSGLPGPLRRPAKRAVAASNGVGGSVRRRAPRAPFLVRG